VIFLSKFAEPDPAPTISIVIMTPVKVLRPLDNIITLSFDVDAACLGSAWVWFFLPSTRWDGNLKWQATLAMLCLAAEAGASIKALSFPVFIIF